MASIRRISAISLAVCMLVAGAEARESGERQQSGALKIVILKGEDAVNIIQQKTAVAPLVEVRDRNNVPVSGAVVTFSLGGPGATFGGASTLAVTTNAAGQAVAAGFTPTAAGAIQINATAVFQGQTAIATITQTNVMTAAQAATAASGASTASGASGASSASGASGAAAGGGGLSTTAIVVTGAAVAGGAVVATQVVGGEKTQEFGGDFSMDLTLTFPTCSRLERHTGTLAIELDDAEASTLTGRATIENGRITLVSVTAGCPGAPGETAQYGMDPVPVGGTPSNLTFTQPPFGSGTVQSPLSSFSFSGTKTGDTIAGTLTRTVRIDNGNGTGTTKVSLTPR